VVRRAYPRALGGAAGLSALALGVLVYVGVGRLGLTLAPSLLLVLCTVPFYLGGSVALDVARKRRRRIGDYPLSLALPSATYFGAFFVLPTAFLAVFAVASTTGYGVIHYGFSLGAFGTALGSVYRQAFVRTLRMAGLGTLLTALVGYPLAYWVARYAPPRRKALLVGLILLPFLTSFLARTLAMLLIFSDSFAAWRLLKQLHLIAGAPHLAYTTTAVQIGLVYNYLPLFILPVFAALERMDWSLVNAAQDLGASGFTAFRQITLRLTAPGLLTGALLVFIPMMGEYVIPFILGGGRVDMAGNLITRSFLEAQNYPVGSAAALLMMGALAGFLALYIFLSVRSEEEYGA
jgi:spermidine/putrescine transport system permease protein